jgi:DNA-binding NarL/FixJ family response regulator
MDGRMTDHRKRREMLTPAEQRVLAELTRDAPSNPEIARRLGIATPTVKLHMATILRKLDARNRAHAILLTVEGKR